MACFTYIYRTSDGIRREEAIEAASRESVFETLRERGIRPIKVIAADGSKENGEGRAGGVRKRVAAAIAAAVLAAGLAVGSFFGRSTAAPLTPETTRTYTEAEGKAFAELAANADAVGRRFTDKTAELGLGEINSPSNVATMADVSPLYGKARDAQILIDRARREMRDVFATVATSFAPDGDAIRDAQRLYGERMAELDAAEISLSNRKFALALLESNRDKWSLKDGEAVFVDARLARMYKYCLEGIETDGATARWQRDFSPVD